MTTNTSEKFISKGDHYFKWTESSDAIRFTVTSRGILGRDWADVLYENTCKLMYRISPVIFESSHFRSTNGMVYEIEIIKGYDDTTTEEILAEAERRNLKIPNYEIGCLIREKIFDFHIRDMGIFAIVTMSRPFVIFSYVYDRNTSEDLNLGFMSDSPNHRWNGNWGFAFIRTQYPKSKLE